MEVPLVGEGSLWFPSPFRRLVKTFQAAETRQRVSEHRVLSTRLQKLKRSQKQALADPHSVFPLSRGCPYVILDGNRACLNINICRHVSHAPDLETPFSFLLLSTHPDATTFKSFIGIP